MLVHTDPRCEKAIILSFPRDLYVDIPGRVGEDKINAAFEGGIEGGGPDLVAKTVQELTGLRSITSCTWTSRGSRAYRRARRHRHVHPG